MASAPDIVDLLWEEHSAIRALTMDAGMCRGDEDPTFLAWCERVLRHEIAEELVVSPALRSVRDAGPLADSAVEDRSTLESQMVMLERQLPGTADFDAARSQLAIELLAHLDREDDLMLPLLATHVSRTKRGDLGLRFRGVIRLAPLRRLPAGVRVATGPTVVDRTTALSVWVRDMAASSGLVD